MAMRGSGRQHTGGKEQLFTPIHREIPRGQSPTGKMFAGTIFLAAGSLLLTLASGCGNGSGDSSSPTSKATVEATTVATRPATATPAASTPPTATESPGNPTVQPDIAFDPASGLCPGAPEPGIDRSWQTSAPRVNEPAAAGDVAQVGLRNKYGEASETYTATATIIAPGAISHSAHATVTASDWAYLDYPNDFAGAPALAPGAHTVIWEIDGVFIACDGFDVSP